MRSVEATEAVPERPGPIPVTAPRAVRPPSKPAHRPLAGAPPVVADGGHPAPRSVSNPGQPPPWGQAAFQALVCRVGPVKIAVPLVKLCEVTPFRADCAPLPHAPDWVLGVMPHRQRQVRVVDLARLILPRREVDAAADPPAGIHHLLLVGEGDWGLGCQEIGEVMAVRPEQVRWRSAAGRRPWLAGTLIERLCALVDVDVLPEMLRRGQSPLVDG